MHIDHGLAPVQFREHRVESLVAKPFAVIAGEQRDAIGLQHIQPVFDLAQGAFHIGKRQGGELAEAIWIAGHQLGGVVIGVAGHAPRPIIVAEPDAGRRHRQYREIDARLVHVLHMIGGGPFQRRRQHEAGAGEILDIFGRREMGVHIHDAARRLVLRARNAGSADGGGCGAKACQEAASAHVAGAGPHGGQSGVAGLEGLPDLVREQSHGRFPVFSALSLMLKASLVIQRTAIPA